MILACESLVIACSPMPVTKAVISFDVGWSVRPRPTIGFTESGTAVRKSVERRSSFGLSIEPPASTPAAARRLARGRPGGAEGRGAAQQLRTLDRASGQHDRPGVEVMRVAVQRIARDELERAARFLLDAPHVLTEEAGQALAG